MRQFSLVLCLIGLLTNLSAQNTPNLWSALARNDVALPQGSEIDFEPKAYHTFELDYNAMLQELAQAPMEFTAAAKNNPLLVRLPLADGSFKDFRVCESPIMAPELTAKYPAIRTYAGTATDGSGTSVRMGVGYQGFNAFILQHHGGGFVVPSGDKIEAFI